ncbi:uncharacterized protein LOC143433060 [Xylocopa sonorina]|uniref:uncharacterized protein LOC143433060 n=1 Tax=Xylocopa sonorina TaxID=1818115 RepID=UPI00403A8D39
MAALRLPIAFPFTAAEILGHLECLETLQPGTVMEVAKVNENAGSLVEQSLNVSSESKSVSTMKSVQSVQTKSVVESSTSIKSVTASSTRSQQSMEYEETVEYTD